MKGSSLIAVLVATLLDYSLYAVEAGTFMNKVREQQMTLRATNADSRGIKGSENARGRSLIVPEYLQDILLSIDEKLRNLDTYTYPLKLAKLDFALEQMGRKLENIETKLGRMETKFDLRMAKVEDIVEGKDMKNDFSNGQLVRQMDNLNEKFNNKFATLDTKFERIWKKLDDFERDFHVVGDDLTERLVKVHDKQSEINFNDKSNRIDTENLRLIVRDEIKRNGVAKITRWLDDNILNETQNLRAEVGNIKNELRLSNSLIDNRTESILDFVETFKENCSVLNLNQSGRVKLQEEYANEQLSNAAADNKMDNITTILQRTARLNEAKFKELDEDLESYSRKVLNGMKESSDRLKGLMFNVSLEGNTTRQIIRRGLDELHHQIKPVSNMEPELGRNLNIRLNELSETVDNKFSILLTAQNTFIDSCRRIQEEESQVYEALGHVLNEVRDRSETDMENIVKNLKNQSDFLAKNLDAIMMAILTSSNETAHRIVDLLWTRKSDFVTDCQNCHADNNNREIASNHIDLALNYLRSNSDSANSTKLENDQEFEEGIKVTNGGGVKHLDYEQDYQMQEADYSDA